jgi:hypothetical protein
MNRILCFRLISVAATAVILSVTPMAEARPLEIPQSAHQAIEGWFQATLRWLDNLTNLRAVESVQKNRPPRTPLPVTPPPGSGNSTTGGSCINPEGHCGT